MRPSVVPVWTLILLAIAGCVEPKESMPGIEPLARLEPESGSLSHPMEAGEEWTPSFSISDAGHDNLTIRLSVTSYTVLPFEVVGSWTSPDGQTVELQVAGQGIFLPGGEVMVARSETRELPGPGTWQGLVQARSGMDLFVVVDWHASGHS